MERSELLEVVEVIEDYYPGKKLMQGEKTFDRWYKQLKDEEYEDVLEAAEEHCKSVEFMPCLANLIFQLKVIKEKRRTQYLDLFRAYEASVAMFPGKKDDESRDAFIEAARSCDDPIRGALWLSRKIYENNESGMELTEIIRKVVAHEL